MVFKIGWFSSGRDEAARELLNVVWDSIQRDFIHAEFDFVFSNRERGQDAESDAFFDLVESYGIPLVCYSSKKFQPEMRKNSLKEWRRAYDKDMMRHLENYVPDLCVLAGYMLITGEELCKKYTMINLHPAEPNGPTGTWQEVIWKLIHDKADRTGVMMHHVTEILDRGPPITYCTFPIRGGKFDPLWDDLEEKLKTKSLQEIMQKEGEAEPLFAEIRKQGVARELPLIIQTIKEFADGKVKVESGNIIALGKKISGAYDLTDKIEKLVSEQD
ncbi:MAG: formyl transferase [Thermoplasmata archaeon]|nr:MAG: formyl transferase [Thermoplasmata archaeon]